MRVMRLTYRRTAYSQPVPFDASPRMIARLASPAPFRDISPSKRKPLIYRGPIAMDQELSNKNLMLSVIRDFGEGKVEPLFAAASPNVIWKSNAPDAFFRFGGTRVGLAEMKAHIALVFAQYHFVRFEPKVILTQGEMVLGQFEVEAFHQRSRKTVKTDISLRWTVRNGEIVEHHGFFDTASVLMQQGDVIAA
jgi:ketosteroid isomerase-like protein